MRSITDEIVASARRMRRGSHPYTWTQIAEHFDVPQLDLIRYCDKSEARRLNISMRGPAGIKKEKSKPPKRVESRATNVQVLALHAQHPDWDSHQIAAALGCLAGYVRATAQRQGIKLPVHPRKISPPGAFQKPNVDALGFKEQLVEDFYYIFDEMLFADRAVFETKPTLLSEFKAARNRGQTLTGFFFGDPLPGRSALDRRQNK